MVYFSGTGISDCLYFMVTLNIREIKAYCTAYLKYLVNINPSMPEVNV